MKPHEILQFSGIRIGKRGAGQGIHGVAATVVSGSKWFTKWITKWFTKWFTRSIGISCLDSQKLLIRASADLNALTGLRIYLVAITTIDLRWFSNRSCSVYFSRVVIVVVSFQTFHGSSLIEIRVGDNTSTRQVMGYFAGAPDTLECFRI
jgi:hypothetical protein